MKATSIAASIVALTTAGPSVGAAQINGNPFLDISVGRLGELRALGRVGAFPDGTNGFAMGTVFCNLGNAPVPWEGPADDLAATHPFVGFMMVRDDGNRMVQISDRSFVQHGILGFGTSVCSTCVPAQNFFTLGLGCSVESPAPTSGSRYWLGPADEVDPWLGTWTPTCSFFDGPDCDGERSYFGHEPDPVAHRLVVEDSELQVAGDFYYQTSVIVRTEFDENRANSVGWRTFTPTWNGASWQTGTAGTEIQPTYGTVLDAWSGASVASVRNGNDDGRVFVASKASGIGPNHHYEYAVHNRDNHRAIGALRIPIPDGVNVSAVGFRDVDADPMNDWSFSVANGELVFETTDHPLRWNSIYNFWFDADAAPASSVISMGQHDPGSGLDLLVVSAVHPTGRFGVSSCAGNGGDGVGCTDCPCGNNAGAASSGGCLNAAGTSALLLTTGLPSLVDDQLSFRLLGATPGSFAVLLSADNLLPGMGPCPPGSGILGSPPLDGLRCIGGNLRRHGTRATDANGDTAATWGPPGGPPGGILQQSGFAIGQVVHFQSFYRDDETAQCMTGQNTSNAITVEVLP